MYMLQLKLTLRQFRNSRILFQLVSKLTDTVLVSFETHGYRFSQFGNSRIPFQLVQNLVVENDGVTHERLVKPVDGKKLRYVTVENMFEILLDHHQRTGHGKRDIMYAEIKDLYANLTQKHPALTHKL